jgi:DNA-binding LytR/AlgR family response regulator
LLEHVRHAPRATLSNAAPQPPVIVTERAEPVLCLQMEDHYVRVHGQSGSTLELMPLKDAIERFGCTGIQVHRSWWVATGAVSAAERDGRNWRLKLTNGLIVPVARNRIVEARAIGLID